MAGLTPPDPRRDVTIVVVNWNGGDLLIRCLQSIRTHGGARSVRTIVIDNNSGDGSREAAISGFPEYQIINSGANIGFGRANNLARNRIETPLVLFLNPDTELMQGTLDGVIDCLNHDSKIGAVGCRMLYPDGRVHELGLQWPLTPFTTLIELLLVTSNSRHCLQRCLPLVDPNRSAFVRKLYGGFMLVRRDVLEAAGWFDERYFMYAEDADLSRTISAVGWKLYYCADVSVVHAAGGTTAGVAGGFSVLMMQESVNKMIRKYNGPAAAVLHRAAVLAGGLARLAAVVIASPIAIGGTGADRARWKASWDKHVHLVLWSLGIMKARIPSWSGGEPSRAIV